MSDEIRIIPARPKLTHAVIFIDEAGNQQEAHLTKDEFREIFGFAMSYIRR